MLWALSCTAVFYGRLLRPLRQEGFLFPSFYITCLVALLSLVSSAYVAGVRFQVAMPARLTSRSADLAFSCL